MLSLFPSLLTYEQVAPFLLRLTLGAVFIYWSYKHLKVRTNSKKMTLGILDGIAGILLVIGLYTQLVALVTAVMLLFGLFGKVQGKSLFTDGVNYYVILLVISLSLLLMGAGVFSFDLPL